MSPRLIHNWGNPLSPKTHSSLIIQAVKRFDGCCLYCNFKMPQTANNPYAGLSVCKLNPEGSAELENVVTLCAFCVNFNDLSNLIGKGVFVELPWFSQSQINNLLRIVYCAQISTDKSIQSTRVYQGSSAILNSLSRIPREWSETDFDGSVEKVLKAVNDHTGFFEKTDPNDVLYIDRLRFFFSPTPFKDAIEYWSPTVESQIMQVESAR